MKQKKKKRSNKKNRSLSITRLLLVIVGILFVSVLSLFLLNRFEIQFDFNGVETIHVQYGLPYPDQNVSAQYTGTIFKFIQKDVDVEVDTSDINFKQLGEYTVTYKASYKNVSNSVNKKVIVEDTIGPDIELSSSPDAYTPYNHAYEEEGFKAIDNYDGDISDQVTCEEHDGFVYYSVTDSHGNTSKAKRKITYDDRKGPVITLDGGEEVTAYNGEGYTDKYSAEDDVDGDVTNSVKVDGSVDSNTNGDYTLTYTVTDAHGNTSEATRTVHVITRPVNHPSVNETNKTIYLTFDDGPYKYTDTLLDILDKYNVKATFFTTSAYPGYAYCIGEEYKRGHTVAVHTATHNYASVYASTDAYWNDFNTQNNVIKEQTGQATTLFRFPGGSSNTISANYCSGIMTTLVSQAVQKGYIYYDWNVSSGDAGETTDTNTVYQNVISGIQANSNYGKASIVLQHDVKEYSVNAVEKIIQWGLENGYTFSALQPGSSTAHHPIYN